jgi:biopolymer transport protein ExbD
MRIQRRELRRARIEIVPMIDTIFFLLIFFMFTSLSMVKMRGMSVSLPKDAVQVAMPPAKVVVTVDSRGRCFLGAQPISRTNLTPTLQARINGDPRTIMIVNVDRRRGVQDLIDVMDSVDAVTLPTSARAADFTQPAVTVATSPVDANGNAVSRVGGS